MDNINIDNIGSLISGTSLGFFFIKSFSIVFSLLFTTYAVVLYKQVQEISTAVQNDRNKFIILISLLQIFIGIFLLFFSILLV